MAERKKSKPIRRTTKGKGANYRPTKKGAGMTKKGVAAYRKANPGSKLKTAVTEKNPKGKRASRRKQFCSRMGGMKKRLTKPENARDPDSPINKALRRWNC